MMRLITAPSMLLLVLPCLAAEDPCPSQCPISTVSSTTGTKPAGVPYQMLWATPMPGNGSLLCATCTPCQMSGSLIFNGNSTGWCIRVAIGGLGASIPHPMFSRPGKLSAMCDDSDSVSVQIVNCATGASSGFTESMSINCGCTPP